MDLGAGRLRKEDDIDKAVGIVLNKKNADKVKKGDILAFVYANNKQKGETVLEVVNGFDMNIRGLYGEGSKVSGDIYQISNKQTLGISEEETIKSLKIITDKVVEQERLARKMLGKQQIELEDKVYRAFGVLANAKKISSEECNQLLSDVKLGTDLGIIKELNDLKIRKLETYTKPANLQKITGQPLDVYMRDIKRAEIIKQIIKEE